MITILRWLLLFIILINLSSCVPVMFSATAGSTLSNVNDRTIGQTVDDIKISMGIKAGLIKKGFKKLYVKITVKVLKGQVLLTGKVSSEEEIVTAIEVAWAQHGVKEVRNEMIITDDSNRFDITQYTKDALITSQIKSKLFINRKVKFVNYTIETFNNIVNIMGIPRSQEELDIVCDIASRVAGVESVKVNIEKVDDETVKKDLRHDKNDNDDDFIK